MTTLASKATTDPFSAADINALVQALRILGVTADNQAYIDLGATGQMRVDNAATYIEKADEADDIRFTDAVSGSVPFSSLGGSPLVVPDWYGNLESFDSNGGAGSSVANTAYLQAIYVPKASQVDRILLYKIGTTLGNVIGGIYDSGGNLLVKSSSTAVVSGETTVPVDVQALATGLYYIALVCSGTAITLDYTGANLKSIAIGSFDLSASIAIPAAFVTQVPAFVAVPVLSPLVV